MITTSGEVFTTLEEVELARLVFKRFGRNPGAALAAWRRLLQTDCPLGQYMSLVYYAEHTASCDGYCLPPTRMTEDTVRDSVVADLNARIGERLIGRVRRLRTRLGVAAPSPFAEYDGVAFSDLEHLVHELAHASLLRMQLCDNLSEIIGTALELRPDKPFQEACAWVVEVQVFERLALSDRLDWNDAITEGTIQTGVTERLMREVRDLWSPELRHHAERIVALLQQPVEVYAW